LLFGHISYDHPQVGEAFFRGRGRQNVPGRRETGAEKSSVSRTPEVVAVELARHWVDRRMSPRTQSALVRRERPGHPSDFGLLGEHLSDPASRLGTNLQPGDARRPGPIPASKLVGGVGAHRPNSSAKVHGAGVGHEDEVNTPRKSASAAPGSSHGQPRLLAGVSDRSRATAAVM